MTPTEVLVQEAKKGDREALQEVVERFYDSWLRCARGRASGRLRGLEDTQALVQSAIADAISDLQTLRDDGALFCWVMSIIRHKIAKKQRKRLPEISSDDIEQLAACEDEVALHAKRIDHAEQYIRVLDGILDLFPRYPNQMAATTFKLLEERSIAEIQEELEKSRETVYRWVREGLELLQCHLESQ